MKEKTKDLIDIIVCYLAITLLILLGLGLFIGVPILIIKWLLTIPIATILLVLVKVIIGMLIFMIFIWLVGGIISTIIECI